MIVFGLYYLIGFDLPYPSDPEFKAPLFTDAVIVLMYVMLLLGIAVAVYSVQKTVRDMGKQAGVENNIPMRRIALIIGGITVVSLVITFVLGSDAPMPINGTTYSDTMWLKAADMFINTSLFLILVAIGVVIFGATRYYRKEGKGDDNPS